MSLNPLARLRPRRPILGPGGEQVTELNGLTNNPVWVHTNVFGSGKLLATYDKAGLHFHFTDWLGTNRSQVNANGTIEETCLSLPFGDSLTCTGPGVDATEHHFTGKERDPESGLDYFGARYFQSNNGRWMSPDWAAKAEPIPYAKMGNPQSLNLYGYVENNPLSMADADGHCGAAAPIQCGGDSDAIADKDAGMFEMEAKHAAAQAGEAARKEQKQAQQQVTAQAKGSSVTYTYPDGSTVVLTGDHPFRDNNPGDLRSGHGSIGRDGKGKKAFAIYASLSDGFDALAATLTGKYANFSISDTMKAFAPKGDGNNPVKYAADLAASIGVPVSTRISALTPGQLTMVQYNVAVAEGYNNGLHSTAYTAPPQ